MDSFAEARELIGDAKESTNTSFFAEDLNDAKIKTESTLVMYQAYLVGLDEKERATATKENHLKFAQLEEELKLLLEQDH